MAHLCLLSKEQMLKFRDYIFGTIHIIFENSAYLVLITLPTVYLINFNCFYIK